MRRSPRCQTQSNTKERHYKRVKKKQIIHEGQPLLRSEQAPEYKGKDGLMIGTSTGRLLKKKAGKVPGLSVPDAIIEHMFN
jgi:hypothetical protein